MVQKNIHSQSRYQCRGCGKKFSDYGITEIEFKKQTKIEEGTCPFCGSEDLSEEEWYECFDCGKKFSDDALLTYEDDTYKIRGDYIKTLLAKIGIDPSDTKLGELDEDTRRAVIDALDPDNKRVVIEALKILADKNG